MVGDDYVGRCSVTCPDGAAGCIGTEQPAAGRTRVQAEVPELELSRYAIDLRSLSHGTGELQPAYAPARADAAADRREDP